MIHRETADGADLGALAARVCLDVAVLIRVVNEDGFARVRCDRERGNLDRLHISGAVLRAKLKDRRFLDYDRMRLGIARADRIRWFGTIGRILGPFAFLRRMEFDLDATGVPPAERRLNACLRILQVIDRPGERFEAPVTGAVLHIAENRMMTVALNGECFLRVERRPLGVVRVGRI